MGTVRVTRLEFPLVLLSVGLALAATPALAQGVMGGAPVAPQPRVAPATPPPVVAPQVPVVIAPTPMQPGPNAPGDAQKAVRKAGEPQREYVNTPGGTIANNGTINDKAAKTFTQNAGTTTNSGTNPAGLTNKGGVNPTGGSVSTKQAPSRAPLPNGYVYDSDGRIVAAPSAAPAGINGAITNAGTWNGNVTTNAGTFTNSGAAPK